MSAFVDRLDQTLTKLYCIRKHKRNKWTMYALWIRHATVPLLKYNATRVDTCPVKWPVPPMGFTDGVFAPWTDTV